MKRIFYADDDAEDLEIFRDALSEVVEEADIITAFDGQELLYNLKHKIPPPPDFLFLDLNMPKKSGHDCLTEIKGSEFYKDLKVIIITTSGSPSDIEFTYKNGADYYMKKPASLQGYVSALMTILSMEFNPKRTREEFVIN